MKVKEFIKMYDMKNIQKVYIYQWNSRRKAVDNIPYAPSMEYVTLLSDNNFNYELPEEETKIDSFELSPSEDDYMSDLLTFDDMEENSKNEKKTVLYIVLPYDEKFKNDYE